MGGKGNSSKMGGREGRKRRVGEAVRWEGGKGG